MGSYLQLQEKDIQDSSSDIRSKDQTIKNYKAGYTPVSKGIDSYEFNTIIEEDESQEEGIFNIENSQDKDMQFRYSEENLLGI